MLPPAAASLPHPGPRLALARLTRRADTAFLLRPDAAARKALAGELGLLALPRLRFEGRLVPQGRADWALAGHLGATVVQPCVVTLAPVRSRIDEPVARLYSAAYHEPEAEETEIPADDRLEPLPESLDLAALMVEALALALPLYPRAPGVAEGAADTPPAADADAEDRILPFAALSALRQPPPDESGEDGT